MRQSRLFKLAALLALLSFLLIGCSTQDRTPSSQKPTSTTTNTADQQASSTDGADTVVQKPLP